MSAGSGPARPSRLLRSGRTGSWALDQVRAAADERDRIADDRERAADERERIADDRDRTAGHPD